jgi:hypothetical protein
MIESQSFAGPRPLPGSLSRLDGALRMAAESLSRSDSYLGARYRQFRGRMGGTKAIKAMARYLACLVYRLGTKGHEPQTRGDCLNLNPEKLIAQNQGVAMSFQRGKV